MKATLLGGGWVRSYGLARTFLALAGALAITSGCGDTARDDSTNGGATAGGATAGGATAGGATAGGATAGGATAGGATAGGATAGGATAGGVTAGVVDDGDGGTTGGGATGAAGAVDDPTTPGNDSPLATACTGNDNCLYATQTCCVAGLGDAKCVEGKSCEGAGGLLPSAPTVCDGTEDCPTGKVCCISVQVAQGNAKSSCEDACGTGTLDFQLCHTGDECPADKGSCDSDSNFPYWAFCM